MCVSEGNNNRISVFTSEGQFVEVRVGDQEHVARVLQIMLIFSLLCYSSNATFFFYYATVM